MEKHISKQKTNGLLTAEDVKHRLQVSLRMVRELTAKGHLKVVKIGRAVRIREQDLEAYIQGQLKEGGAK